MVSGRKATLNCVKFEVALLGSPSLTVPTVSVDVKQHHELCELEVAALGSPSPSPAVAVDVKHH